MDRMAEAGVKLIRQALEALKAKQYIEIRQEIPDQELRTIATEIMSGKILQEAVANILSLLK
jgi:hypothetical protein